jgi:D-3-phosphoglycerate dehydrogenase
MIGQVTSEVAQEGINISSMINRSRGEWAYTVLDLDEPLSEQGLSRISSLQGIYKVRLIQA